MTEIYSWVIINGPTILNAILAIIGGAAVATRLLAPLTKNTVDDRVAGFLGKLHVWGLRTAGALNKLAAKVALR